MAYQSTTILGNLGRDVEVHSGCASFSVAVSEKYTNKAGEKVEHTEWFNVKAFGRLAEVCEKYLSKGQQVLIEGRLKTNEHNGKKYVDLVASNVQFVGGKPQAKKEVEYVEDSIPF